MNFEEILYDKSDGIATITLNRPERMNAFTNRMLAEWTAALADARDDDDVRAVVVTGAGRGFCAGMDVRDTSAGQGLWDPQASLAQRRHFLRDTVHQVPRTLATLDKPYIGAINGPAVGAGMDMASMCDIRIAADTARFGMAYVRMGLVPGDGGCYFLPRIVGLTKALELIWTGDIFDAQEALRIGYVSEVVPADQLMERTRQFALRLARGPAVAIQLAKRLVYRSLETNMNQALELAESAMIICQSTEDAREGPRAWVEKREPQFKGR
ncbi:MAG: enoyl-CoA hydratase/isomerase family protein [Dehalococcoidia bacterium]